MLKAFRINPDYHEARLNLGEVCFNLWNYHSANFHLKKMIESVKNSDMDYYYQTLTYFKLGIPNLS